MIRNASTGKLGGAIVNRYDANVLNKIRNKPAEEQVPAHLGEADSLAWQVVHNDYPKLPTNSLAFKRKCSDQLVAWARQRSLEADPTLAKDENRSLLEKKMSEVLMGWARQSNANVGAGNKSGRDSRRVWLG